MSKYIVALDSGTTGNKAIAFDLQGNIAAYSYTEFPQIFPKSGWVEQNPYDILNSALKVLKDVIEKVGVENVLALGITNQRETTILWDKETGEPLYNAIVWQCRRSAEICERLSDNKNMIKDKTGLFLDPYFSATKVIWLNENIEKVRNLISKGNVLLGTVDSWLLYNLTSDKLHLTDITNASRTMFFNINTLDYDRDLLKLFEIPDYILPEVKPSGANFGVIDKKYFGKEIPITAVIGDQQSALFAHGGWREGLIKNTYGTGLFLMTSTKNNIFKSNNLISTVAWQIEDDVEYALEGSVFIGGSLVQWLRDNLNLIEKSPDIEHIAANVENSNGVYIVPAFSGIGAPYWDHSARGVIIGITRGTTKEHIARAALEAIAFQVKDIFEELRKDTKIEFKTLSVDGGASENRLLLQIQADMLGLSVEKTTVKESTAFGAAALAGIVAGVWDKSDILKIREIEYIFNPDKDYHYYQKSYKVWKEAVKRSLGWGSFINTLE
ncbi:glycerol kinase [Deferribacter desulfuricans SSM1]|uniref:glycerol kinase n=1 Tax=Deferribacter desulfuricans (strain DSM 14783 / JCM 11476 / NBRC 101012 / SSM1) TaxID=639282 RepID=D3PDM5_DEFDS|nr:glycerol kinase GlpK [Deferribacter desulfuricans]BAI80698.1 glycerol kinase [Deferribacter desulfuricans SSM1]